MSGKGDEKKPLDNNIIEYYLTFSHEDQNSAIQTGHCPKKITEIFLKNKF